VNTVACNNALLAVVAVEACSDAADDFDEGAISRANASAVLCTGVDCRTLTRAARDACNGVNDDVSHIALNVQLFFV